MTGLELLEALSFVDAKYIQEAETANLNRNTPWMKWLSLAACLCILITGVLAYGGMFHRGPMEGITEQAAADAPAAAEDMSAVAEERYAADAPAEGAPLAPAEEMLPETEAGEEKVPTDELQHISAATLRIINLTDEGFEAIVEEESADTGLFEVGMQVTVVIDPGRVPGSRMEADSASAEKAKLAVDLQVAVENSAYDAGTGTLYVDSVILTQ